MYCYYFEMVGSNQTFDPNNTNQKLGFGTGVYVFKNIPEDYPLAILNGGAAYDYFIEYVGDNYVNADIL